MHTRIDLMLCNRPENESKEIIQLIYSEINHLETLGNYFDPQSELFFVNRNASKESVQISPELFSVINQCVDYNKSTEGCFDITVESEKHDKSFISSLKMYPEKSQIYFEKETLKINLSGFLKGYALDKTRIILQNNGITDALINIGNSSVMALGNHPYGEGWKIDNSLRDFEAQGGIVLRDNCLTTSGNNTDTKKHIISPDTGKHIEGQRTISVVTEKGTEGEVLSTALFVASPEQQRKIQENFHVIVYGL